jgi:hypothetical protein
MKVLFKNRLYTLKDHDPDGKGLWLYAEPGDDGDRYVLLNHPELIIDPTDAEVEDAI